MKRLVLMILCGMVFYNLNAQDADQTRYTVSGGLLGAANFSKFRIPDNDAVSSPEYDSKTGWSAGAWVNIPVSNRFTVEPQLMYSVYKYYTNSTVTQLLND